MQYQVRNGWLRDLDFRTKIDGVRCSRGEFLFATPQARVARNSLRKPPLRPRLAPPVMLGLIGDARMTGAIWSFAQQFLGAAETKVRLGRIAIGQRHIDSRISTWSRVRISAPRLPNRLGRSSFNHERAKARAVLPTTCGLFACRWAARRGALWCGGEAGTLLGSALARPDSPSR